MKFLLRKNYEGKNLFGENVSLKEGSYLESDDKYILYNGLPIFAIRSSIAKSLCIWADDGHESQRLFFESGILFNNRIVEWTSTIPIYNEDNEISGYEKIKQRGRFSPKEVSYIRENFKNLLTNESVLRFNDYFYVGSSISEIGKLYNYLYE